MSAQSHNTTSPKLKIIATAITLAIHGLVGLALINIKTPLPDIRKHNPIQIEFLSEQSQNELMPDAIVVSEPVKSNPPPAKPKHTLPQVSNPPKAITNSKVLEQKPIIQPKNEPVIDAKPTQKTISSTEATSHISKAQDAIIKTQEPIKAQEHPKHEPVAKEEPNKKVSKETVKESLKQEAFKQETSNKEIIKEPSKEPTHSKNNESAINKESKESSNQNNNIQSSDAKTNDKSSTHQPSQSSNQASTSSTSTKDKSSTASEPIKLSSAQVMASWRVKPNLHFDEVEIEELGAPKTNTIHASFNFDEKGNISGISISSTGSVKLDREIKKRFGRAKLHPKIVDGSPRSGEAVVSITL